MPALTRSAATVDFCTPSVLCHRPRPALELAGKQQPLRSSCNALLFRCSGRRAARYAAALPRPHAARGVRCDAARRRRRQRRRLNSCAGASSVPHACPRVCCCPSCSNTQVEELRQRLSAIMPPLEVGWQQDATVNATRLPSVEHPLGASPFGASFAFQRRHSMRPEQRAHHTAAAAAAAQQAGKQGSPQPDEQLHGDSRSASGEE